jgi:hypothetical protein
MGMDAALGYVRQLLCSNPEAHLLAKHPEVWAGDEAGRFETGESHGEAWPWRHPGQADSIQVSPALMHVPRCKPAGCSYYTV